MTTATESHYTKVTPLEPNVPGEPVLLCRYHECKQPATHRIAWKTRYMCGPAFYYECADHASRWE